MLMVTVHGISFTRRGNKKLHVHWRFAAARFNRYLDPLSPYQLKNVRVGPPLTKPSGSAHGGSFPFPD